VGAIWAFPWSGDRSEPSSEARGPTGNSLLAGAVHLPRDEKVAGARFERAKTRLQGGPVTMLWTPASSSCLPLPL